MEIAGRVATWLELALVPVRGRDLTRLRVHPVGGRKGGCYAVSMDGRWLCASDVSLTVFRGRVAAERFLEVAGIDEAEPGDPSAPGVRCDGRHLGLCLGRGGCLVGCRERGLVPEFNG
jgi:hypothetical protein